MNAIMLNVSVPCGPGVDEHEEEEKGRRMRMKNVNLYLFSVVARFHRGLVQRVTVPDRVSRGRVHVSEKVVDRDVGGNSQWERELGSCDDRCIELEALK